MFAHYVGAGIHRVNDIGWGVTQVKIVLEVIVPVTVIED